MRFTTLWNDHLIDWRCEVSFFVCLFNDLILSFCYSNLDTGNRWTQTRIEPTNQVYYIIESEPTNQVCLV